MFDTSADVGVCDDTPPREPITPCCPPEDEADPVDPCDDDAVRHPVHDQTVDYATGRKLERITDLTVAANGRSFVLSREYSSDPTIFAPGYTSGPHPGEGLLGANWVSPQLQKLTLEPQPGGAMQFRYGWSPVKSVFTFAESSPGVWTPGGPATQRIEEATIEVEGESVDVWRLGVPGKPARCFYRRGGPNDSNTPAELEGYLLTEYDLHGNRLLYSYVLQGPIGVPLLPRLVGITVNGERGASNAGAEIVFEWIASEDAAISGRLASVIVYRRDELGVAMMTQRVDYTYRGTSATTHVDTGLPGDLLQVTSYERVSKPAINSTLTSHGFRARVTQYRYHDGGPAGTGDLRLATEGAARQLKMVIAPEQIEYYAQRAVTDAVVTAGPEQALLVAAEHLLTLADDAVAFTEADGLTQRKVVDLASKIVSYELTPGDDLFKVRRQFVQAACGCGGAATQGMMLEYDYFTYTTADPEPKPGLTARLREYKGVGFSTLHRTLYADMVRLQGGAEDVPYLRHRAIVEPGTGGRAWVDRYEYDGNRRKVAHFTPSVMDLGPTGYVPVDDSVGPPWGPPVYTPQESEGLAHRFTYTTDHRLHETWVYRGSGLGGEKYLVERVTYPADPTDPPAGQRAYLPNRIDRFRTGDPGADPIHIESTWFEYGFHGAAGAPDALAWVRTTVEAERVAENGPDPDGPDPVVYDRYELLDALGRNRWSRDETGALTYRDFNSATGAMIMLVRNARSGALQPVQVPILRSQDYGGLDLSGWGDRFGEGGMLVTKYEHDLLGRLASRTGPGGVTSYTQREMALCQDRPNLVYYSEVMLPHKLAGTAELSGPATRVWLNAGGQAIASAGFTIDGSAPYSPTKHVYTPLDAVSREATDHTLSGLVSARRQWPVLSASPYLTSYTYDDLGRLETITSPNGTVTRNVAFDVHDRVLAVAVGLNPTNQVTVAEYFYDHVMAGVGPSPEQGIGNGNLTLVRRATGELASGGLGPAARTTVRTFDFRDRLVKTKSPETPYELMVHDNLGRVVERGLFTSDPAVIGAATRGLYARTHYSQRGLPYRQEVSIDPDPQVDQHFLATNTWYDAAGRSVATWGPNAPGTKTVLDGLGRPTLVYFTDRGGDVAPGAANNYAHATGVVGDTILEQQRLQYNASGLVALLSRYRRLHGSTHQGELSASNAVATYRASVYDGADRAIATVDYGVPGEADLFASGGVAPEIPTTIPSPADELIISQMRYDERGLVGEVTDPKGHITRYVYDALGRRVATVENAEAGANAAMVSWDNTAQRWTATGVGGQFGETDIDRVTTFTFDGSGNLVYQTAHLPGDQVQVTQYVYDYYEAYGHTDVGDPAEPDETLVVSNDLLHQVRYPNPDNFGQPGTTADLRVAYYYNAAGELRSTTDQNKTQHVYHRDSAGRVTSDRVVGFGPGSTVDQAIRSIHVTYDTLGRLDKIRSAADTAGATLANDVRFRYTPLWQVEKVYQDHDGPVQTIGSDPDGLPDGNTAVVEYVYATSMADAGNYSRLEKLIYPDGTKLEHRYGASAGDLDDLVSRLTQMRLDTQEVVEYSYVGLGMVAKAEYPEINVLLDRTYAPTGLRDQAGLYPGWDRFGRVQRHAWIDGDMASTGGTTPLPTRPSIVELAYRYDANSNRTHAYDDRPGAGNGAVPDRDFQYEYDGLDRLKEAKRGSWNGTLLNPANGTSQKWALDMLGNWDEFRHDVANNASYTSVEARDHNLANEITSRTPPGGAALPFDYDPAGNMRTRATSTTHHTIYTHDAWNRLVKVETGPITPGTNTTVQTDRYNGLHWRVQTAAASKTRTMTYGASWQLLQEDLEIVYSPPPFLGVAYQRFQNVWGARYIDDMVLRRLDGGSDGSEDGRWYYLTDAQFSVRAVLDDAAKLIERVRYSAYGVARHGWRGDTNGDGATTLADRSIILGKNGVAIGATGYSPDCDLDRSGTINLTDVSLWAADGQKAALPAGWISNVTGPSNWGGPDNPVGYCGYMFSAATQLYTVRHRHYDVALGVWLQRDPLKYLDSMNLYQYVRSAPIGVMDPLGLCAAPPSPAEPELSDLRPLQAEISRLERVLAINTCLSCDQREQIEVLLKQLKSSGFGDTVIFRIYGDQPGKFRVPIHADDGSTQYGYTDGIPVSCADDISNWLENGFGHWRWERVVLSGHGQSGSLTSVFSLSRLRQLKRYREDPNSLHPTQIAEAARLDRLIRALGEHADVIDVFACNVGSGTDGTEFKRLLEELSGTSVDVAEYNCGLVTQEWEILTLGVLQEGDRIYSPCPLPKKKK